MYTEMVVSIVCKLHLNEVDLKTIKRIFIWGYYEKNYLQVFERIVKGKAEK